VSLQPEPKSRLYRVAAYVEAFLSNAPPTTARIAQRDRRDLFSTEAAYFANAAR